MKKKTIIRSLLTLNAVSLVLFLCSACHQKSSSEGGKQLSAEDYAKKMAADSIATEAKEEVKNNSALFTYAAYSGDSRSPNPMISVHSDVDLLYRRQS